MSVTSEVEIMNSGLIKIGADTIISVDEQNSRARACKTRYYILRDARLRSHPWKFATGYASIAPLVNKPEEIWDFKYVYNLPQDCLRVLETNLSEGDRWAEIADRQLACNVSELKIKYVRKITDVSKYDANFCEVLALDLAIDLAYLTTQSAQQVANLTTMRNDMLRSTRSFNAQIGTPQQVEANLWVNARRY